MSRSSPHYQWLSRAPIPPARWGLRQLGWTCSHITEGQSHAGAPVVLDWREGHRIADWRTLHPRQSVLAVGVNDPAMRASLIASDFGDAVASTISLIELAARLHRIDRNAQTIPRYRSAGPVVLDIVHRDGFISGRRLALHPREFALLWRLAELPLRRASRKDLLADVWQLSHVPPTNSLEVHISRLRAKLAVAGAGWLIQTHPMGGYCIGNAGDRTGESAREMLDRVAALANGS